MKKRIARLTGIAIASLLFLILPSPTALAASPAEFLTSAYASVPALAQAYSASTAGAAFFYTRGREQVSTYEGAYEGAYYVTTVHYASGISAFNPAIAHNDKVRSELLSILASLDVDAVDHILVEAYAPQNAGSTQKELAQKRTIDSKWLVVKEHPEFIPFMKMSVVSRDFEDKTSTVISIWLKADTRKLAAEEAARQAAEKLAADSAAQELAEEAARKAAADSIAKAEAQRIAIETAAQTEAEKFAADAAAKAAAQQLAAEEAARQAAIAEAAHKAALEEASRLATIAEAARKAAEEAAAMAEAERIAAEAAARQASTEEAAPLTDVQKAAEEAARIAAEAQAEAERLAAIAAGKTAPAKKTGAEKRAEKKAAKAAEKQAQADKKAAEEAARQAAEAAEKAAAQEAARRAAEEAARQAAAAEQARKIEEAARRIEQMPAQISAPATFDRRVPAFAVSTNLLYDAVTALNVGLEIPLGHRWSIRADYMFPWWVWDHNSRAFQILHLDLSTRLYLGERTLKRVMTGWYLSLGAGIGYYDFEPKNTGIQGEEIMGSIGAGYSVLLGRNWTLDFGAGFGPIATRYRHYIGRNNNTKLIYQYDGRWFYVGPTNAHIGLTYTFGFKSRRAADHLDQYGRILDTEGKYFGKGADGEVVKSAKVNAREARKAARKIQKDAKNVQKSKVSKTNESKRK